MREIFKIYEDEGRIRILYDQELCNSSLLGGLAAFMEEAVRSGRLTDDGLGRIHAAAQYLAATTIAAAGDKDIDKYVDSLKEITRQCLDYHRNLDKKFHKLNKKKRK